MKCMFKIHLVTQICFFLSVHVQCLHLKGTWKTSGFYKFLTKFGFQKTDPGLLDDTQGFVYGNITSDSKLLNYYTLVLVDSEYFMEFYGNQSVERNCKKMFQKIDTIAYDNPCNGYGTEDFLRKIPCPKGQLCVDEDNPANVLSGFQFTYKVQNSAHPRFWYLSLVACHRKRCNWTNEIPKEINIDYDIWLVNGDPASKHLNPFEHQFSFEMHDVFEIYAIFSVLYIPTIIVWFYAYKQQVHLLTKMVTMCIGTEFIGVLFNFFHVLIFSFNGVGATWLKYLGNFLGIFAECLFMLVLLGIARGWTITSLKLQAKRQVFCFWGIYTTLNAIFFIVSLTKLDEITNIDEWNAWPGYLIVSFRIVVMIWFFLEFRSTLIKSQDTKRVEFLQQFGAFYLVWFLYLPVLVIIADQISYLWRYKTILSITYGADWISYIILIHLIWPSRSVLYLIKGDTPLSQYELEATGLVDDDDDDEVVEYAMVNLREPYGMIKQETKLPTIAEDPSPKHKSTKSQLKNGMMKVKGQRKGSKTNLLNLEEHTSETSFISEDRSGNVYTNVSLSDDEDDLRTMNFEVL